MERIINIANQLGIRGGVNLSHDAAAKTGVIGFSKVPRPRGRRQRRVGELGRARTYRHSARRLT